MKRTRVAINGFGRVGRAFCRAAFSDPDIEIVAINDLSDIKNAAYLLRYDTAYGQAPFSVSIKDDALVLGDQPIPYLQQRDPAAAPWGQYGVDVVVEATGVFRNAARAKAHLDAGARRVVITAPVKGEEEAEETVTVLSRVNDDRLQEARISSNASCTTNAASPLIGILSDTVGVSHALLNTVHAYTASQSVVDAPSSDYRKGRAAAANIIPTSTGAAVATTKAHTHLASRFDGIALRVPVTVGSIVDITFVAARETSAEEINQILRQAAQDERWRGLFTVVEDPVVSSDIIGAPYAAIADLAMTRVVGGTLGKVLAWYDNETGYAHTLIHHIKAASAHDSEPAPSETTA